MKKYKILLALVIIITFLGGFFSGVLYSSNYDKNGKEKTYNTQSLSHSEKHPPIKNVPNAVEKKPKVLIGYVQDFRNPDTVDYTNLTHVIFSFAHPTKDGHVLLTSPTAKKNLKKMVDDAHSHNKKAMIAIGGWFHLYGGVSYQYFKPAIVNPVTRERLVNELISLADQEKLDGIDIDFEHPRSQQDAQSLAAFAKSLGERLHSSHKELSLAVHAKINSETLAEAHGIIYDTSMFQYADHVNIMAYDGQWDGGYNAANLSPYPFTEKIVNYWSGLFEANKIPKEKLVLGVPLYGQPDDPAIKQVSYSTIIKSNPENAKRDTIQMNGTTYHYNGETTIQRKTNLALTHGFGGMMLWEEGHDLQGPLSASASINKTMQEDKLVTSAK
ncbi:glycoside hydrolase family 18 protein [Neobacillus terrae]|uniref:glycoside hydrolase family 18 protein n=1 Tax=Neobacillus terrae TaxID=3034837 RepID=UPI00140E5F23|nr:glycoside hydrolase family 18 protein [Neobacillus terrae]NHM32543.1 glycoside hydrolase family 18 protein [Neobacillus terrae]